MKLENGDWLVKAAKNTVPGLAVTGEALPSEQRYGQPGVPGREQLWRAGLLCYRVQFPRREAGFAGVCYGQTCA